MTPRNCVQSWRSMALTTKIGEEMIDTPLLVLTVHQSSKWEYIFFGLLKYPTRPYCTSLIQCFGCWPFGNTKARCKTANDVCGNCRPIEEDMVHLSKFCSSCEQHCISSRVEKEVQTSRIKNDYLKRQHDSRAAFPAVRPLLNLILSAAVQPFKCLIRSSPSVATMSGELSTISLAPEDFAQEQRKLF